MQQMTLKSIRHVVGVFKRLNVLGAPNTRTILTQTYSQRRVCLLDCHTNIRCSRKFQTWKPNDASTNATTEERKKPGSIAFADCETDAIADLFLHVSGKSLENGGIDDKGSYLSLNGVKELLNNIGEKVDAKILESIFVEADSNNGKIHLKEFLNGADKVLGDAPARIILVVGGPGSGKGILCRRLAVECGIVHLSSGDLLRDEVNNDTPLGRECAEIMKRGELVSSAVITALVRRRMRAFPGRRVLLDGFPRSLDNAYDFMELCGTPELALHLECEDTLLMERILKRSREATDGVKERSDDNFDTAVRRIRTFHKYHKPTMDWLSEQHVPIVNLDCSGSPGNVWDQLLAVGRLMRPATQLSKNGLKSEDGG